MLNYIFSLFTIPLYLAMTSIISQTHHKVPENIVYVMGQYQSHVGNMKGQIYLFNSKNVIIDDFLFCFKLTSGELCYYP